MLYIQRVNEVFLRIITVRIDAEQNDFNIDAMVHKMVYMPKYSAFKRLAE